MTEDERLQYIRNKYDFTIYEDARNSALEIKALEKYIILDKDEKAALIALFPPPIQRYGRLHTL